MGKHRSAFAVLALFLAGPAVAADKADFTEIDKHALAATADDEKTLASLARYLAGPCKTDTDKARAAYRWVTDRIAYDVDAYLAGRATDESAETALKRRMATCGGSVNLYLDLCKRMGLEAVKVNGHVKIDGVPSDRVFTDRRYIHTWNAVNLAGAWKLVDTTWGAGTVEGKVFVKGFNPYYFCTPPDRLLFTHLPTDRKWQLVEKPISDAEFLRRPMVGPALMETNVSTKDLLAAADGKDFAGFPIVGTGGRGQFTEARFPLNKTLKAGEEYVFEFRSATLADMAIVIEGQAIAFEKNGDKLTAKVTARKGKLAVGVKVKEGRYDAVLLYMVE